MRTIAELAAADWHRLNRLLESALAIDDATERERWLAEASLTDADLVPLVQQLLARPTGIETGAFAPSLPAIDDHPVAAERAGQQIGPYRLIREIGAGGMGTVWLAERADGAFERQMALKLPRAEWTDRGLAQRFARERAVLASLNHPHIAQLFDAGWSASGRPYLALEYVEGLPIDAWCAQQKIDTAARLALFVAVIRAVAHAHARLVVHRDLKPSNVLVTHDGQVKLLDFGIAKLLAGVGEAAEATELTQLGGRALTPQYAAPEQILGKPVSTSADVYALGVLLFEVLTGERPYRLARDALLRRSALEEAILHVDAPAPSSVAKDAATRKAVRGDVDAIVLKALAKQPEQRYETAAAFADDIERHLAQLPVRAQREGRVYRLGRFVARNRLAVGAVGAVIVALAAGLSAALWQARVARDEAARATLMKDFVLSIIQQADPVASRQTREADVALLTTAEARVDQELANHPELALQMRRAIGAAYRNRGDFARARAVLRKGIDQARPVLPPDHIELLGALVQIADELVIDTREARRDLEDAVLRLQAGRPAAPLLLADALVVRHRLLRWSEPWHRLMTSIDEMWSAARATGDAGRMLAAAAEAAHGSPNVKRRWEKVLGMTTEALAHARDRARVPTSDPRLILATVYHGFMTCRAGKSKEEAVTLARGALDAAREHHGPAARVTQEVMTQLARTHACAGSGQAGLALLREAYAISVRRESPDSQYRDLVRSWLVEALFTHGGLDEIEPLLRETPIERGEFASNTVWLASTELHDDAWAASVRLRLGDTEGAERIGERGLERLRDAAAPAVAARLYNPLARALYQNRKYERAEMIAAAWVEELERGDTEDEPTPQAHALALYWLGEARRAAGRPAAALAVSERATRLLAEVPDAQAPLAPIKMLRGRALLDLGRPADALESLAAAHEQARKRGAFDVNTARYAWWYGQALIATGDAARGRALLDEAAPELARSRFPRDRALVAPFARSPG